MNEKDMMWEDLKGNVKRLDLQKLQQSTYDEYYKILQRYCSIQDHNRIARMKNNGDNYPMLDPELIPKGSKRAINANLNYYKDKFYKIKYMIDFLYDECGIDYWETDIKILPITFVLTPHEQFDDESE